MFLISLGYGRKKEVLIQNGLGLRQAFFSIVDNFGKDQFC